MLSKPSIPGILLVNSDVIKPEQLSRKQFDTWYCEEHIPDVVAKSGVQSASRYNKIVECDSDLLEFVTIYDMPDLNFMESKEFKSLEGQSPGPNQQRIFKNAKFDTRAYEYIRQDTRDDGASTEPPKAIVLVAFDPTLGSGVESGLYDSPHEALLQLSTYQGTKWYKLLSRSILSGFERTFPAAPKWLAVHAFSSNEVSWNDLGTSSGTAWGRRSLTRMKEMEGGSFVLNRIYR